MNIYTYTYTACVYNNGTHTHAPHLLPASCIVKELDLDVSTEGHRLGQSQLHYWVSLSQILIHLGRVYPHIVESHYK